jgi:hypothetical protein
MSVVGAQHYHPATLRLDLQLLIYGEVSDASIVTVPNQAMHSLRNVVRNGAPDALVSRFVKHWLSRGQERCH